MHQEVQQNFRTGSKGDLLILLALVAGVFLIKYLIDLFAAVVGGALLQGIAFIVIAAVCLFVYKKRLSSFGYAFYYKEVCLDEADQYGDPINYPFEVGTFIASKLSGAKATSYHTVHVREMIDFLPPRAQGAQTEDMRCIKMTVYHKKTAHRLIFEQEGKTCCWYIHPSKELTGLLNEAMRMKKAEMNG